jgi:hypothetical protein
MPEHVDENDGDISEDSGLTQGRQLDQAARDALFSELGVTSFEIDYDEDFIVFYDKDAAVIATGNVVTLMHRDEEDGVTEWWPNPSNRVVNPSLPIDVEALGKILDSRVSELAWADFWIREKSLFIAVQNFEPEEAPTPVLEEVSLLVNLFARAMSAPEGTPKKYQIITEFQAEFGTFLKTHPSQSVGTFAGYLADVGIPYGAALADVVRIQNFRVPQDGLASEEAPSEPEGH